MVQKGARVTAIYDIHGNLPALEAVLAELESVNPDLIVVGGDAVAGPRPTVTWRGGATEARSYSRLERKHTLESHTPPENTAWP
jgi:Icc-related predicted phosphoesterase